LIYERVTEVDALNIRLIRFSVNDDDSTNITISQNLKLISVIIFTQINIILMLTVLFLVLIHEHGHYTALYLKII